MLYLVEVSTDMAAVRATARGVDPLTSIDSGYAVKTWLAANQIGLRPWSLVSDGACCRVVGWSRFPPKLNDVHGVRFGFRECSPHVAEPMYLSGVVVPIRRTSGGGKHPNRPRDAAEGREDNEGAYVSWLRERLIALEPDAEIQSVTIDKIRKIRVMRKVERHSSSCVRKIVREESIPVVSASLVIVPKVVDAVENWLLLGVGPNKAFGYGGFFPC